jgi:hypothetical protein
MLFGLALIVCCYLIGKNWLGKPAGLLAAFLALVFPVVSIVSRQYFLEIPLAAICAATVYLLLRTDAFENRKVTIALGLVIGLGMWTKETYPLFVLGPIGAHLILTVLGVPHGIGRRRKIINGLLACGIGAALSAPFYLPKLRAAVAFFLGAAGSSDSAEWHGFGQVSRLDIFTAYNYMFAQMGVSLFYAALFVVSGLLILVLWIRRRPSFRDRWQRGLIISLWFVLPYIVSSTSFANDLRYMVPAMPAFALLLAGTLTMIPWKEVRVPAIVLAVVVGVVQFYAFSYSLGEPRLNIFQTPAEVYSFYPKINRSGIDVSSYARQIDTVAVPNRENRKTTQILSELNRLRKKAGLKIAQVYVIPNYSDFSVYPLLSESWFRQLQNKLVMRGTDNRSVKRLKSLVMICDFLVVKPEPPYGINEASEMMKLLPQLPFVRTNVNLDLPNGSHAIIYKRMRGSGYVFRLNRNAP